MNQTIYLVSRYLDNTNIPPILMMVCPTKSEADRYAYRLASSDPRDYDNLHMNWSNEWDEMAGSPDGIEQYKMNILVFEEVMNRLIEY